MSLRHWSWAMAMASSSLAAQLRWICRRAGPRPPAWRYASRTCCSVSLEPVDGDQCVGPFGMAGSGLGRDGRSDEVGNRFGQCPQSSAVDVNEPLVAHLFTREEAPDDVDAFDEALVALPCAATLLPLSARSMPRRSQCCPDSSRKHLRKSCDRLGDDRRVVALSGRIDHSERKTGRGQRGAEKRPREPDSP